MYARVAHLNETVMGGVWAGHGAVVWGHDHHKRLTVTGVGSPDGAARLAAVAVRELPSVQWLSLPGGFQVADWPGPSTIELRHNWQWMWTTSAPRVPAVDGAIGWLDDTEHSDVERLLDAAMPEASTWPGDARAYRWAGLRNSAGTLVACLADTSRGQLTGHVSSVATASDHRRKGYAAALMAWVTRDFLVGGKDVVTLGVYATNRGALRFYEKLGFAADHTFTAATLVT